MVRRHPQAARRFVSMLLRKAPHRSQPFTMTGLVAVALVAIGIGTALIAEGIGRSLIGEPVFARPEQPPIFNDELEGQVVNTLDQRRDRRGRPPVPRLRGIGDSQPMPAKIRKKHEDLSQRCREIEEARSRHVAPVRMPDHLSEYAGPPRDSTNLDTGSPFAEPSAPSRR